MNDLKRLIREVPDFPKPGSAASAVEKLGGAVAGLGFFIELDPGCRKKQSGDDVDSLLHCESQG